MARALWGGCPTVGVQLLPMASASSVSPFPTSPAGSEPSAGVQQPPEDPSPRPAVPRMAAELGKLLLLRSRVLCFAAASRGGRIRAGEATRGNALPARSQTCRQENMTILARPAGPGQPSLRGGKRAGLVYLCSTEAFTPLSHRDCARQSPGRPLPAGPTPCPFATPWRGRWSRAQTRLAEPEQAEMNSGSQETAGTNPTGGFSRCTLSTHSFSQPWGHGHPGHREPAALEKTEVLGALGSCCPGSKRSHPELQPFPTRISSGVSQALSIRGPPERGRMTAAASSQPAESLARCCVFSRVPTPLDFWAPCGGTGSQPVLSVCSHFQLPGHFQFPGTLPRSTLPHVTTHAHTYSLSNCPEGETEARSHVQSQSGLAGSKGLAFTGKAIF